MDQLINGVANESKVGYWSFTSSVQTQIAKDVELMNSGVVNGELAFLYESRYWTGWPESAVAEGASEFGDWGNSSLKITP